MASLWPSSWPPRDYESYLRTTSLPGWRIAFAYSPVAAGRRSLASRRSARRSNGATTCSRNPSGSCFGASRPSSAGSTSTLRKDVSGQSAGRRGHPQPSRTVGRQEDALAAHFAYFLEFAERAYAARVRESLPWLARLERDHDDLRAAMDWSRQRDAREHLRLVGALAWFWHLHSEHLVEGAERLEQALAAHPEREAVRARALTGFAMVLCWLGDFKRARQRTEEAIGIWEEIGDRLERAFAVEALGWSHCLGDDNERALEFMEQALAVFREEGEDWLINRGLVSVGQVLVALGRVDQAVPMAEELLASSERLGDLRGKHYALHYLGDCALAVGDPAAAQGRYARSPLAALAYGNIGEAGVEMQGVAMSTGGVGDLERAFVLNGAAEAKMREVGMDVSGFGFWTAYKRRYLNPAREAFGLGAAEQAEARGAAVPFAEAVRLATSFRQA